MPFFASFLARCKRNFFSNNLVYSSDDDSYEEPLAVKETLVTNSRRVRDRPALPADVLRDVPAV